MNQKKGCCIFRCLHDSLDFTGVLWVPRQSRGDPQTFWEQLGNQWEEASVGLQKGEEAGRKQAGIPLSCCPCTSNVWWSSGRTDLCQKHLCFWGQSVMHGLAGFFSFFFPSRPIQLSASWSWKHILCKKLSFREKSVFEEFSAYTHPCVWNCFTSVPSNT